MAQSTSRIRPSIDRFADVVEQLERSLRRRGRDIERRFERLERAATRRRRSVEREAQRRLRRVRADLGWLRVDLKSPSVPGFTQLLGLADALRVATRRDVKERVDPVERRVNQLARRLSQLEGGRRGTGSASRTRTRRSARARPRARTSR